MKLDKIKFTKVIGFISMNGFDACESNVNYLDELIDIDVTPVEIPGKVSLESLGELIRAIHANEKLTAIKELRILTGAGLKEAKDAVEKDWNRNIRLKEAILKSIADQMNGVLIGDRTYTLNKFNNNELQTIRDFINSFY